MTHKQGALFGDAQHFSALREPLGPWLRSRPMPKIWVAECTAAEDVFSLAILLHEEGLYERARIFATSANESLLEEASRGAFAAELAPQYAQNYRAAGGRRELSDYYTMEDGQCVFLPALRANITWAQYQLASDASFNEFELIMCRDTLDAFGPGLTRRSLQLFHDSLARFGILSVDGIDNPETIPFIAGYTSLLRKEGLYRRVA
jgi:chemotaxis protein methyltransferase CheR